MSRGKCPIYDRWSAAARSGLPSTTLLCVGAVAGLLIAPAIGAERSRPVRLRHRLMAGSVSVYHLQIETMRRAGPHERKSRQAGTLTRVMFSEPQAGEATCAQMVELEPAAPEPQSRPGDHAVPAWPPPEPWVQFSTARVSAASAPLAVPGRTAWSREVLSTVLRVTDWPPDPVAAGQAWESSFHAGSITGRQRVRVEDVQMPARRPQVTLAVELEPDPPKVPSHQHVLSAQARVVFSAGEGELLSLEGRVAWRESAETGGGDVITRIDIQRSGRSRIGADALSSEREAVSKLAYAAAAYQREDYEFASQSVKGFAKRWPQSRWQPVAGYIERLVKAQGVTDESLTTDELRLALARLTTLWSQAELERDPDVLAYCRSSLSNLMRLNRPEITRLLDDEDPAARAAAVLAMAFGSAPADVALIEKGCRDPAPLVRQEALRGLAIRASPLADMETLLKCLSDEVPAVRRHACGAIAASAGDDGQRMTDTSQALNDRLRDDAAEVVLAAARALLEIGSPDEIRAVRHLARTTPDESLQAALASLLAERQSPEEHHDRDGRPASRPF